MEEAKRELTDDTESFYLREIQKQPLRRCRMQLTRKHSLLLQNTYRALL